MQIEENNTEENQSNVFNLEGESDRPSSSRRRKKGSAIKKNLMQSKEKSKAPQVYNSVDH